MNYAHEYGIETPSYYTGIAAMLLYSNPTDKQSVELQKSILKFGIEDTLTQVCGLSTNSNAIEKINDEFLRLTSLKSQGQANNSI